MAAPKIEIIEPNDGSVIKLTSDQQFQVKLRADAGYEYDLWTDWETGKFHSFPLNQNSEGIYLELLNCNRTGMFKFYVRYREKGEFKFKMSKIDFEVHVDGDWIYDAIVYNIFLRAFGAKGELKPGKGGTFQDVIDHMDEFVALGINTLYINPFHIIGELFRKYNPNDKLPHYLQPGSPYSIRDPKSIDPEVAFPDGDDHILLTDPKGKFKKLVEAAHKRGIRVIMDLVFNHTSHDFVLQRIYPEWFLYKENITSAEDPYIYFNELHDGKPWGDPKHTVVPYDHGDFSWTDTAQLNWEYMLPPAPNDPPPNTSKKEMYEYFKSIPKYWIKEFGIDGFRCDVAYKIPSDFWYQCIKEAKEAGHIYYPENGSIDGEVIFIAESFHINMPELFKSGFSFVYGDYSNKIFSPINLKGYLDYMYNIETEDFPQGSKWFIFPECHDFHRTTSKLVPHHMVEDDGTGLNERDELAIRGNSSRWVLTATLPGMPMVFTGFEKVEWAPVDHVSYSRINWEDHKDIYTHIQKINKIRHNHLSLQKGKYQYIPSSEGLNETSRLFSFARYTQDEVIIVAVNMDIENKLENLQLELPAIAHFDPKKEYILKDLINGKIYHRNTHVIDIILEAGASHIFLVEQVWG